MVRTKIGKYKNICNWSFSISCFEYSYTESYGIVLGWSIAYNLIWAVISSLWSSYFETEVRYSGISFVYHVPSFLVAGMVPTICTLLINYGKGDTIYVGIYSTVVALISAACALALKARHDRGEK